MRMRMLIGSIGLLAACYAEPLALFVSPQGNDANPGTADRPLATPAGARDALRARRARHGGKLPDAGAVITFAAGTYSLAAPLELDARDAGTETAPVVWRAAERTKAIWTGALPLADWRAVDDPAALALLPEAAKGHVIQADLPSGVELPGFRGGGCGTPENLQEIPISVFQGETRLELARWPNDAFVRTGENIGVTEKRHDASFCRSGVFKFASDRLATWAREPELWCYGLWCYEWADAKAQVRTIDPAAGTIAVDPSPIGFGIKVGAQFHVLNALSELDRPGEWVVDRARRRLYVWPHAGAARPRLALAAGLVRAQKLVNVHFDGLLFECSRLDAVKLNNTRACSVRSSVVRHTSSWGVIVAGGASNRVEGCDLYDLGEGGVQLLGGDFRRLTPAGNVADNNHIHHYGAVVPNYRPGVSLLGVGNRCTHNLIHHTRHQAVSFGGNDHLIAFNVIHDTCMFNDDAGAIYCCQRDWSKRGTVIEHNLIHFTGKPKHATHSDAVYLDDYSSGIIVRGNLINRASLGVHIGGGQDNVVERNVIMNCGASILLGSRGIDSFARGISLRGRESGMFQGLERNRALFESPLWKGRYPNMMRVFDFPDARHAHDAHFNVLTNNLLVTSGPVQQGNWKFIADTCVVADNPAKAEDPGFADYANFDWNLKPGALRDSIGDLRLGEMGLYASPLRVSPAVKFGADVTPPPPLRVQYAAASVRIDLPLHGELPAGVAELATGCVNCTVPGWGRGKRVMASFGTAEDEWKGYSFTFVPTLDGTLQFDTMGARGEKTLYDDFRVTGAELVNGGFEVEGSRPFSAQGWRGGGFNPKDYRIPFCNTNRPYGVITAVEAKCEAAEGRRMFCGSDVINLTQRLKVKKGVPVTVSFKARALPTESKKVSK